MRAVDLIREDVRPSQILTQAAFENALRVSLAVSGSTNLVLHFIAMAKEAGIKLDFDFIDRSAVRRRRWRSWHRAARGESPSSAPPAAYPPCCASSET